jgi:hypothetical protein
MPRKYAPRKGATGPRQAFVIEGLGALSPDEEARAIETLARLGIHTEEDARAILRAEKAGSFANEILERIVEDLLTYRQSKRVLGVLFRQGK